MATLRVLCFRLIATSLLASAACAQDSTKPLNLTLPEMSFPAAGADGATPNRAASANTTPTRSASASATTGSPSAVAVSTAPGVYYGDTPGAILTRAPASNPEDTADSCDDSTFSKPQVHGTVETGVIAGNHFSGNYQSGTVSITQPTGSCEHPKGSVSISVGASQGRFDYPHSGH